MKSKNLIVLISFCWLIAAPVVTAQESENTNESKLWIEKKNINGKKVRVLKGSKAIETVMESPEPVAKPMLCEIDVSTDYWQANDKVKMDAYVDTSDCGAAYGRYSVSVRTKDEAGEHQTRDFAEAWSRDNADPIKLSHSYTMNGDSDLVKVRVKLPIEGSCVCGVQSAVEPK